MLYRGHELSAAQRQQQACSDQSQASDSPSKQVLAPTWHPPVPGIERILGAGGTTWWTLKSETLGLGTGPTSRSVSSCVIYSPLRRKVEDGEQMFQEVETHKLISMEGAEILLLHNPFHGLQIIDFVTSFYLGKRWRTLWATAGVVPSGFWWFSFFHQLEVKIKEKDMSVERCRSTATKYGFLISRGDQGIVRSLLTLSNVHFPQGCPGCRTLWVKGIFTSCEVLTGGRLAVDIWMKS